MQENADIRIHVACRTTVGEGPLWDVEGQRLYWIDGMGARIFRCTAEGTEIEGWDVPAKIGSMALRKGGGAVVCLETGFHLFDFKSRDAALILDPEGEVANVRLNDGKVDRQGRFVVGSMDTKRAGPRGSLYRLDPDLSVHVLARGFFCANGPCWSPDGRKFYFADTGTQEISIYDYDLATGALSNKRLFGSFKTIGGGPDGATVDAEGFIWSVAVYAGQLLRFTPEGEIDRIIKLPVQKMTSVTFGGPNLDVLYLTSMAQSSPQRFPEDGPIAGHLFAIHGVGVRGLPERRFEG